jgi:hypothetical protein
VHANNHPQILSRTTFIWSVSLALLLTIGVSIRAAATEVSPSSLALGTQTVGTTSAAMPVELTNNNRFGSIEITAISSSVSQFAVSGVSLPLTLNQGQSLTVMVTFSPTAAQTYSGSLVFTLGGSHSARGSQVSASLSGTGVQQAPVAVAPSITSQPVSQTITSGQTATFSVAATGTAPLSYQWTQNGAAVSGATSASYTTPATTSNSGSTFSVTVSDSAGSATSNNATLTVNAPTVPPSITTQPVSQTITSGQTATFSVAATGTAPLGYQWTKSGAAISGATSASYTTPATTTSNSGSTFGVIVSNSAGSVTSNSATLTVNAPPPATVPPSITTQPISQTIASGLTATFSVAATGTAPLTYQWTTNGAAISGATSASYTTPATTSSNNGSTFSVTVTNSAGSATSSAATLTVSSAQWTISSKPPSLSFTATVGGSAPAAQQAKIIDNDPACTPFTAAVTQSWLSVTPTSSCAAAFLSVSVNPAGLAAGNYTGALMITSSQEINSPMSVPITLTITATSTAPTITTQPASQAVSLGQTATFSVAATGTAPLTYQWTTNGAAISGATSASYTTPATTSSNNGSTFSVTVTNSAGSVTSTAATLTVNAASTYTLSASPTSLAFGNINVSASKTLQSTLTNSGNANVTISNVSISGPGLGVSGASTGQVLTPGQTATLSVTFDPASAASVTGSVTVTSNATNSPTTISLSGTGVQAAYQVTLSWTASTSSVIGYDVYRSTASGGPYTELTTAPVTTTSYVDSTVQAGDTYYYAVTSVNSSNVQSALSSPTTAVVP